jgi:pimeloyl-ACP methyl ester carboxylesterase
LANLVQDIRFCTTSDGVKLAYAVSGDGPPLVMSATWLTHLEHQWRSMAWRPWLDAFSHGRKLLRYDARGCGLSDRVTSDLSFDNWVSDFECVIASAGFDRFDLLATCWGGPIAITYAARHPERVNRLILYGTYALGRLRWNDRPKEIEKARVLLDLTRLGWGHDNHAFQQVWASVRRFSRAARSTTCAHGASSNAQPLPPRLPFVCCRSAGTPMCAKRRARSNARS